MVAALNFPCLSQTPHPLPSAGTLGRETGASRAAAPVQTLYAFLWPYLLFREGETLFLPQADWLHPVGPYSLLPAQEWCLVVSASFCLVSHILSVDSVLPSCDMLRSLPSSQTPRLPAAIALSPPAPPVPLKCPLPPLPGPVATRHRSP